MCPEGTTLVPSGRYIKLLNLLTKSAILKGYKESGNVNFHFNSGKLTAGYREFYNYLTLNSSYEVISIKNGGRDSSSPRGIFYNIIYFNNIIFLVSENRFFPFEEITSIL